VVKSSDILEQQIELVSSQNGVSAETLRQLLALEESHRNLHTWGARPALRREIDAIIEADMANGEGG
jgi:hypothetical protein